MSPPGPGETAKPLSLPKDPFERKDEARALSREVIWAAERVVWARVASERKRISRLHPLLFGLIYCPDWLLLESADFHWEISNLAISLSRLAVAAPAGSGKTVVLTKLVPLWKTYCTPCKEILTISASAELAQGWLDEVRVKVETSEELREDYGDVRGMRWGGSDLEFVFHEDGRTTKRAIMKARGKGCAIRGLRPDHIFLDDPEDEQDCRSDKQGADLREWLWGALITRLDTPSKQLTFVGTALDSRALICEVINAPKPGWVARCYSALLPNGDSIWPQKWSLAYLAGIRAEVGEARFQADFMNAPIRFGRARGFRGTDIRYADFKQEEDSILTICVDPSFSAGGDPWAITVVEVTRKGDWRVHEYMTDNSGMGPCLEAIFKLCEAYPKCTALAVEIGGGGQSAMQFNIEDMAVRRKLLLPPLVWLRHTSLHSKDARISLLVPLFEAGRVCLRTGMVELRNEIVNWRPGAANQKDNIIDSLAMHLEVQIPRSSREHKTSKLWHELSAGDKRRAYDDFARRITRDKIPSGWERYLGVTN